MAYATVAQIAEYGEFDSPATDLAIITTLIPMVQAFIDSYCRRTFEADTDTTHVIYGDNILDNLLILDDDLAAITSVTIGATAFTAYRTEPKNKTPYWGLRLHESAPLGWDGDLDSDDEIAVRIVGKWAYSATVPADINLACMRLTYIVYKQRVGAGDDARPMLTPSGNMVMPTKLPADIVALLEPYRRLP